MPKSVASVSHGRTGFVGMYEDRPLSAVGMPSAVVQGANWFSRAVDVVECDQELALASAPQKHVGDACFVFGSGSAWVGVGLDVQRVRGMFRDGVEAGFSTRRHRLRVAQFVTLRRREDRGEFVDAGSSMPWNSFRPAINEPNGLILVVEMD